jgi:hypothetical protein
VTRGPFALVIANATPAPAAGVPLPVTRAVTVTGWFRL